MKNKISKHAVVLLTILLLMSCSLPAGIPFLCQAPLATPDGQAVLPPPPPTNLRAGLPSLFEPVTMVDVTPAGNLVGGDFVRVGYVPGKDRIVVAFQAKLAQKERCPSGFGYAYKEFTTDMVATGQDGVLSCYAWADSGGLFAGNNLYVANMGHDNKTNQDGWWLAKYDAVTWKELVSPFFFPVTTPGEEIGDPMVELVNGQIDISSTYRKDLKAPGGPFVSYLTHHQFFTTDLHFVGKRVLSDTPHINLSSLIAAGGAVNFVTSTSLLGDMIVMRYDTNWKYLGSKTLKARAAAPEGVAFDGTRFYVSYLDAACEDMPCYQNVHLAAFDANWNSLEDMMVTSYTPQDHKQANRPTLTLWNNRIYVAWDQAENEWFKGIDPHDDDIQVHVKVYDLANRGNANQK